MNPVGRDVTLVSLTISDYTLEVDTQGFCDVIDVTAEVQAYVGQSGVRSGQVTVFNMGSTAAVTTVEFEPGCVADLAELFERLAPATRDYHHEQTWHDGNGFSHMRASLLKPSLTVPLLDGRLRLGTWQQIVIVDFDNGPRRRKVAVQVIGQ